MKELIKSPRFENGFQIQINDKPIQIRASKTTSKNPYQTTQSNSK
jgi:hypothetical protein